MSALNNIRPATPVTVEITFLRMDHSPRQKLYDLPDGYSIQKLNEVPIPLYRYVYGNVGTSCCWWMRRVLSDQYLEDLFADPSIEVYLLKDSQNIISGFFELDCRLQTSVNIAYFGLMPHVVGKRIGTAFFHQALKQAWSKNPKCVRINTCNLDHPRAIEIYEKSGFERFKVETELWNIPDILNLPIPEKFLPKIR